MLLTASERRAIARMTNPRLRLALDSADPEEALAAAEARRLVGVPESYDNPEHKDAHLKHVIGLLIAADDMRLENPMYRALLREVWCNGWGWIAVQAVADDDRERLKAMFARAEFPIPADLPPILTLWRGASGIDADGVAQGHSWTDDRDTACRFALHQADNGKGRAPLVIRAEFPRGQVAAFFDGRGEREFVLFDPPAHYVIDGDLDDWTQGRERFERRLEVAAHG